MSNRFRIIGGEWRSRRFMFPDTPELRPSPDRVRETLFNWLAPVIDGARCLDLYAGSGAIGLEALSRGATEVVFVDRDRAALAAIDAHLTTLSCDRGRIEQVDALAFIARDKRAYDIVFADPPFDRDLIPEVVSALASSGVVKPGGMVYLESEAKVGAPALPDGWTLHRSGKAGRVGYHLLKVFG